MRITWRKTMPITVRGWRTLSNWLFSRSSSRRVEDFLTQLALLTNVEAEDEQPASKDDEQLRLSTIHQAKGLEFDVVFVIMLCDGLFPSARSLEIRRARRRSGGCCMWRSPGPERALPELPADPRRFRRQRGHAAAAVTVSE